MLPVFMKIGISLRSISDFLLYARLTARVVQLGFAGPLTERLLHARLTARVVQIIWICVCSGRALLPAHDQSALFAAQDTVHLEHGDQAHDARRGQAAALDQLLDRVRALLHEFGDAPLVLA